jgi:hypothetical protein
MMPHPAFFTAELFVRPSIADLFTAVQTLRQHPQFSFVAHDLIAFSFKYRQKGIGKARARLQVFLFFKKIFTNL